MAERSGIQTPVEIIDNNSNSDRSSSSDSRVSQNLPRHREGVRFTEAYPSIIHYPSRWNSEPASDDHYATEEEYYSRSPPQQRRPIYHVVPRSQDSRSVPYYAGSIYSPMPHIIRPHSTMYSKPPSHPYLDRTYDYEAKYDADGAGQEAEPNARIWKVYLDETEMYDKDMMNKFRDTIDSMLVFAALFSAVVSTFAVETSQALQPNYGQLTTILLSEQMLLLRASGNSTAMNEIPPSSLSHASEPALIDVWINGLFFASLAVSLITAVLSVLTKQWLQAYESNTSADTMERSLIRQFRNTGLVKWKLPQIVGLLPLLLHIALAIFLVGLSLFLYTLHHTIALVVTSLTGAFFICYVLSAIFPLIWLQCPYRTTVLYYPLHLGRFAVQLLKQVIWFLSKYHSVLDAKSVRDERPHLRVPRTVQSIEHSLLQRGPEYFEFYSLLQQRVIVESFSWLFQATSNISVQKITVNATGAFLSEIQRMGVANKDILLDNLPLQSMIVWTCDTLFHDSSPPEPGLLRFLQSVIEIFSRNRRLILKRKSTLFPKDILQRAWSAGQVDFLNFCLSRDIFVGLTFPESYLMNQLQFPDNHDSVVERVVEVDRALHIATAYGNILAVKALLDNREADVNHVHPNGGGTVLHAAAFNGNLRLVNLLLSHDANRSFPDAKGNLPLHLACFRGHVNIAHVLANTVDINIKNNAGHTPLHSALYPVISSSSHIHEHRLTRLVRILLDNGADMNLPDIRGTTPLFSIISTFGIYHSVSRLFLGENVADDGTLLSPASVERTPNSGLGVSSTSNGDGNV